MPVPAERRKAYHQAYYRANREKMLAEQKERDSARVVDIQTYQRGYRERNKPALLTAQRVRGKSDYQANKEAYKARAARWKAANPERMRELQAAYTEKNREAICAASAAWYLSNKAHASAQARKRRLKGYGLTGAEYLALLASQGGGCAICGAETGVPGKKARLPVDHCHKTGAVRGLLCLRCNTGLGMFMDDPGMLQIAIRYLTSSSSGATLTMSSAPPKPRLRRSA